MKSTQLKKYPEDGRGLPVFTSAYSRSPSYLQLQRIATSYHTSKTPSSSLFRHRPCTRDSTSNLSWFIFYCRSFFIDLYFLIKPFTLINLKHILYTYFVYSLKSYFNVPYYKSALTLRVRGIHGPGESRQHQLLHLRMTTR